MSFKMSHLSKHHLANIDKNKPLKCGPVLLYKRFTQSSSLFSVVHFNTANKSVSLI